MLNIKKNINLQDFSGLKVGAGFCTLYEVESYDDFEDLLLAVPTDELNKMQVVGEGTNTVFVNEKEDAAFLKINSKNINEPDHNEKSDETISCVGAGVNWDFFVQEYMRMGGVEMERLSMIPGTVGAAPVQNIGAYGAEVSEFIHSVYAYDRQNKEFKLLLNQYCEFSYRDSIFKKQKNRFIILSVNFILKAGDQNNANIPEYKDIQNALFNKDKIKMTSDFWTLQLPENIQELKQKKYSVQEIRDAVVLVRANKLPDPSVIPNCGSFFKNPIINREMLEKIKAKFPDIPVFPVHGMSTEFTQKNLTTNTELYKIPLAYIIEKIGLKGYNQNFENGNFGIYKSHALVVVSNGNGNILEFKKFVEFIKQKVKDVSGLEIEEEVNLF